MNKDSDWEDLVTSGKDYGVTKSDKSFLFQGTMLMLVYRNINSKKFAKQYEGSEERRSFRNIGDLTYLLFKWVSRVNINDKSSFDFEGVRPQWIKINSNSKWEHAHHFIFGDIDNIDEQADKLDEQVNKDDKLDQTSEEITDEQVNNDMVNFVNSVLSAPSLTEAFTLAHELSEITLIKTIWDTAKENKVSSVKGKW